MNQYLDLFRVLSTISCLKEENKAINLLEGSFYLKEFYSYYNLIKIFVDKNINFNIISGFKSEIIFKDKSNKFNSIILSVDDYDTIESILKNYKYFFKNVKSSKNNQKLIKIDLLQPFF